MQPAVPVPETTDERPMRPRRKRLPLSFLIAGIVILGAVGYLIFANTQANSVFYITVSELKNCNTLTCTLQSVRVEGTVQAGTVKENDAQQQISFVITQGGQTLAVFYSGIVPDIFRPGIDVVVEGHYSGSGPFQAQTLLTKCPSKFQSTPNS